MRDLDRAAAALGVLATVTGGRFRHLATAWSIDAGEWVTALAPEDIPGEAVLLAAVSGEQGVPREWEIDAQGVVGFRCSIDAACLQPDGGGDLRKRQSLYAVGYPCVIDHPAFALAPASLTPERYLPYLCPWVIDGHLALFSADDGWLTGRFYVGMNGSPVFDERGSVVGMVIDGQPAVDHPALTRFRRLG